MAIATIVFKPFSTKSELKWTFIAYIEYNEGKKWIELFQKNIISVE